MAMTLEDTERLFGRPRGLNPLRKRDREAEAWLAERTAPVAAIPGWAPLVAAAVGGVVVGAILMWLTEARGYRALAIVADPEWAQD